MRWPQIICTAATRREEARSLPVWHRHVGASLCGSPAGSVSHYAIKVPPGIWRSRQARANAISSALVFHVRFIHSICAHVTFAPETDEFICPNSSVNGNTRLQPYGIIVPGLVGYCPKVASMNKGLSELILTLALLVAILSHNKYNSCLVFLSFRISAPSVSLVCGKHCQTVYYAKTYLWRGLFVRLSFTPHLNPALTMDSTAPPPPNPTTPTRRILAQNSRIRQINSREPSHPALNPQDLRSVLSRSHSLATSSLPTKRSSMLSSSRRRWTTRL